jgi:hypothetical protein
MLPDERLFRAHLESDRFLIGVHEGRWRLDSLVWPVAIIAVTAAPRAGAPNEFTLRTDFAGYPHAAPTACIWDVESETPLPGNRRPREHGQILRLFQDGWQEGRALYAPYDRVTIEKHPAGWADQWPRSKWTPERDLTFFLNNVYEELHADGYIGI